MDQVCTHPKYDDRTMDYDIALLRLDKAVSYSDAMRPICLPSSTENFPSGTQCVVTGWGKIRDSGPVSDKLRVASVPVIDHNKYKQMYGGNRITERMTCAGYERGGIDSCQGDSGGPLACMENGTLVLAGVVSWGFGCANERRPGVYTNTINLKSWIQGIMD